MRPGCLLNRSQRMWARQLASGARARSARWSARGRGRVEPAVAREVEVFAVADHGVEGAGVLFEGPAPGGDAEAVGVAPAESGEVDDAADDRGRPRYPPVGVEPPSDVPRAGVERVEGAVVGAEED